ncbi:MAG: cache domain-containing protein [Desulfobacterales bacterium]|nr:cache domain-containing protein [Desulfobacterales bacterium]
MNWKNLSIFKKIGVGPGIVIIFLVAIGAQSFLGVTDILNDSKEVIYGNRLDGTMTQKEVDQLAWANRLGKLLKGEDPGNLDIETDHTKSSLGKWLYGEDRKIAEQMVPELAPLFKNIEVPHKEMYESAKLIKETYKPNHNGLDLVLSKLLGNQLTWVADLGKAIAEESAGIYVYQSLLKTSTQQAMSQIKALDKRTDLTLAERKALAYENLKNLRYGENDDGYFFILDTDVNMVMHPHNLSLEGKSQTKTPDKRGDLFFNDIVEVAQANDSGFVTYYWQLPGSDEIAPKISFSQIYKPWNWVIATGFYVDHTNARLMERVEAFAAEVPYSCGLQLNHKKTDLGKFILSEEAQKLAEEFPALKETLAGISAPHQAIHILAVDIEDAINELNMPKAIKIYQNQVQAKLDEIQKLLTHTIEAEKALKQTKVVAETIFTEQTLPKLAELGIALNEIRTNAREHITTDAAILNGATSLRTRVVIFSSIAVAIGICLTFLIAASISRPLTKTIDFAKTVASGDLTQKIDINQKDEVGSLCVAMNEMSGHLNEMFTDVNKSVHTLTSSATELSAVSEQITNNSLQTAEKSTNVSGAAEEMTGNMNSVAAATEQATSNVQMIVSAVEEMSSTINEISKNTSKGSQTTSKAVENAKQVSIKVDELGQAASEISKVTDSIADISEQTNLLALNATIEAARAGEAGKGFAVVANEIKALALQTAEATQEISSRIDGVQVTTNESIQAIETIVNVINDIDAIVISVATAIEEQSAGTQEISQNVNQAASGLEEVNQNVGQTSHIATSVNQDINEVSRATDEMKTGSSQVMSSATELSRMAESLNEMISRFKI